MFSKENIFIEKKPISKSELFKKFAKLGFDLKATKSVDPVYKAILAREEMGTTGFTNGFAIPHCLTDEVIKPTLLVAKLTKPLDWGKDDGKGSLDGEEIQFAFCLLITKDGGSIHLNFLKQIARSLMDEQFRAKILSSKTEDQINKCIMEILSK